MARAETPALVDYDQRYVEHWHDGHAELAGYDLTFPRYGELRHGRAVSIVVTEPFSPERHVKADHPGADDIQVLKLNLVQDFQTGIYDYNLMTSAFVATAPFHGRPAGSPAKVSFSSQEWCGHVFAQVRFGRSDLSVQSLSYFESEGDQQLQLGYPAGGFAEDALLLWARGLAGPALSPGQSVQVPMLRSLQQARLQHLPLGFRRAELSRAAETSRVTVPAGAFEVQRRSARVHGGDDPARTWHFDVELSHPHRVVRFGRDDGLQAELRGSTRLPYWQLNAEGHDKHLGELGF